MNPTVFTIFTGDDKTMNLKAVYADSGDPLDLTDCTEISIPLPNADGTFRTLLKSLGEVQIASPEVLGKFSATITSSVSALMKVGEFQSFDVTFTIDSLKTTVGYPQALTVFQR